ncbi:MAG: hypothetical protein HRU25_07965 [Psychrobium sp.]|nr:hypothetical protein [Psychrobium sp.]
MQPKVLVSRMALKAQSYELGGQTYNLDVIDWRAAAYSLCGLKVDPTNWALYRYVGNQNKRASITRSLIMSLSLFIKINRFKVRPETLEGLINAAILEHERPVCRECHGSGLTKLKRVCQPCDGRGRIKISKLKRCRIIGVNKNAYSNSYEVINTEVLRIIANWELEIDENVKKRTQNEDEAA